MPNSWQEWRVREKSEMGGEYQNNGVCSSANREAEKVCLLCTVNKGIEVMQHIIGENGLVGLHSELEESYFKPH